MCLATAGQGQEDGRGIPEQWSANKRSGMIRTSLDACKEVEPCHVRWRQPAVLMGLRRQEGTFRLFLERLACLSTRYAASTAARSLGYAETQGLTRRHWRAADGVRRPSKQRRTGPDDIIGVVSLEQV